MDADTTFIERHLTTIVVALVALAGAVIMAQAQGAAWAPIARALVLP
jgi:hypothetical protein